MNARTGFVAGGVAAAVTAALVVGGPAPVTAQSTPAPAERAATSPSSQDASSGGPSIFSKIPNLFRPNGNQRAMPANRTAAVPKAPAAGPQIAPGPVRQVQQLQTPSPTGESEIQRQLRALYQKNGLEMPAMNMQHLTPQANAVPTPSGPRNLRRRTGGAPSGNSLLQRLKRLWPFGRSRRRLRPRPRTMPAARYRAPASGRPPVVNGTPQFRRIPAQPAARTAPQFGRYRAAPAQVAPAVVSPRPVPTATQPSTATPPVAQTPAKADIPLLIDDRAKDARSIGTPAPKADVAKGDVPVLIDDRSPKIPVPAPADAQPGSADGVRTASPDPFPKAGGTDAAATPPQPPAPAGNPFTGLKLSDEDNAAKNTTATGETAGDKPAGADGEDLPTLEIRSAQQIDDDRRHPLKQPAEHPLNVQPKQQATSEQKVTTVHKPKSEQRMNSSPAEKMRRIVERRGMVGFRGFCPVVLRDERDVVDALPAFHSEFQGKTWYFSSAEAKFAFDQAPQKYVPAVHGKDVVLKSQGKGTVAGSLEHAVWFRDRLYFFSSAETLKTFVKQPKKYAVAE